MLSRTIGTNARKQREKLGWSQEHLAHKSEVCVRTISTIECGIGNPTADVIEAIAGALGVAVSWLVS